MRARGLGLLTLLALTARAISVADASCTLAKRAELPVTMIGLVPTVHASINGTDALFIADSGAFYSTLTPAGAAQFGLSLRSAPFGFILSGIGGTTNTMLTTVNTFTIFGVPIPKVEFIVAGNDLGNGTVGLLGQNVFRAADSDIEYDLANGRITLMHAKDCGHSALAYWATSIPYSVIDIEHATAFSPHTRGVAFLNGNKIQVMFDTGAAGSALALKAARRAGVTLDSPGVIATGASKGVGQHFVNSWVASFSSFKIGDEEIRNAKLRILEALDGQDEMLIGADFFLSHRVYVSNSQRKLYFTYNGGPVFNLTPPAQSASAANRPAPGAGTPDTPAANDSSAPSAATPGGSASNGSSAPDAAAPGGAASPDSASLDGRTDQPTDAAGFSRRGAAAAARHDFARAIADLTRACELDPNEASYFYQRGMARWQSRQPDLAMSDFEQALKLKPDDLRSLVARAGLHVQRGENPAAIADLDAASKVAAKQSDLRLELATDYWRAGDFAGATAQYTLWIDSHGRGDVSMLHVLYLRCSSRGRWGQELKSALSDCDTALRATPKAPEVLDSRALVRLRRNEYDKAIADYDQALSVRPQDPWARYLRGVAKMRKGLTAEGQADLAAALSLDANIAERTRKLGITP
jgi:tetratricopeptide (TPR) repeat protein/predicted aspartyl protease